MATKSSTKKTTKKSSSKNASAQSIEIAVQKGVTKGIENTVSGFVGKHSCSCKKDLSCDGASGWMYFLGIVGAMIYYIATATSFWNGVLGVLKAFIWPAMVVLKILGL